MPTDTSASPPGKAIRAFLSLPTFDDERKTLQARKLWAVLFSLTLSVSLIFPLVIGPILGHEMRALAFVAAFDGVFFGSFLVARRGYIRTASLLLLVSGAIVTTLSVWTAGGLRAPGIMAYPLLVGIAGILEGAVTAGVTAASCAAIGLFLMVAEVNGFLPPAAIHHTPVSIWFTLVLILLEFVVVQIVVGWVVRRAEEQLIVSARAQRENEEAMRETEEKFEKLFRASLDGIIISELESGRIIDLNTGYMEMIGYSREELIGRTTIDLGIFEDMNDRRRLVETIKQRGFVRDWEIIGRNKKGQRVYMEFSGELVEMSGRTCMVSIVHDVTERKIAEARERESRDEFTRKLLASQEAERRRIAAELHDSLGQNLIVIKNRAQLGAALSAASPHLKSQFESLLEMASQAISEVRQISHALRPHQLDQLGLTRALGSLIDSSAQSSGFPIERKLDSVDDLFSADAATHIYRIVQETISNILKHANAKSARIGLERDFREVVLWIEDDGQGFKPLPVKAGPGYGGLGLGSITERARILRGTLTVNSVAGKGTRIEVVIPFPGQPADSKAR